MATKKENETFELLRQIMKSNAENLRKGQAEMLKKFKPKK